MIDNLVKKIASDRKYQLVLGVLVVAQFAAVFIFSTRTQQVSDALLNFADAALVRTVTMVPTDTAQATCPNGVATVVGSADKKRVEVFCNPVASASPSTAPTSSPSTIPSPSSTPSPSSSPSPPASVPPGSTATPENFKVAFIGDSGGPSSSYSFDLVLDFIKAEGAQMVLHQGDMGYDDSASQWESVVINKLDAAGQKFPYFMSDGNHDSWSSYEPIVAERALANGLGNIQFSNGGNYTLTYQGLKAVFTKEGGDTAFVQQSLNGDQQLWKVCSWHHNRNDFQAGGKSDDVDMETYQACLNAGAIIATGHEHSYSRACTITDFTSPSTNYGADCSDPTTHTIIPGQQGMFFVSGNGGKGLRDYHASEHDDDGWWYSIYTTNRYCKYTCTKADLSGQDKSQDLSPPSAQHGATFITFNVDGDPRKAVAYHKLIDGTVIDEWTLYSQN